MGRRGRQKAKQTRVARELKYSSGPTDLDQLQRELAAERHPGDPAPPVVQAAVDDEEDDDEDDGDYRRYSAYEADDDQPANGTNSR
jgi:Protein of unknown function (DUF3073)